MSEFGKVLEDKCMNFAVRIVNLCHFLKDEKREYLMSDQIFRSGTSIGANVAESQCAISTNDFVAKLYISLKECNETLYWLDLLKRAQYLNLQQYNSIYSDCEELKKMLTSITKTTTQNSKLKKE